MTPDNSPAETAGTTDASADNQQRVDVDPVDVIERDADGKGRVTLGADYSQTKVRLAIIDVLDVDEPGDADFIGVAQKLRDWGQAEAARTIVDAVGVDPADLDLDDVDDEQDEDDGPERVTLCEDCGEIWAGRTTYCDDCGSEKIRQVEPRTEGSA